MSSILHFEISQNQERLQYYKQLQLKNPERKAAAIEKWIAIYEERVQKLEKKAHKVGLKFQLPTNTATVSASKSA